MIRYVNELLLTLTGFSRHQLVNHDVQMLVPSRLRYADFIARHGYVRDPKQRLIRNESNLTALNNASHELSVDFTLSPITIDHRAWAVASIRDNIATKTLERARRDAEGRAVAV